MVAQPIVDGLLGKTLAPPTCDSCDLRMLVQKGKSTLHPGLIEFTVAIDELNKLEI
jgi:hypothetical protein